MNESTEFRNMRFHCKELVVDGEPLKASGAKPSAAIKNVSCTTWTDSGEDVEKTINAMLKAMRDHGIIKP